MTGDLGCIALYRLAGAIVGPFGPFLWCLLLSIFTIFGFLFLLSLCSILILPFNCSSVWESRGGWMNFHFSIVKSINFLLIIFNYTFSISYIVNNNIS